MWTMRFQYVAFQLTSFSGKLIFWHVWAQFHVLFLTFKILQMSPLVQHFGGQKSLLESTMEKKPLRPPLVGGDWNHEFYDFPFSWEWNVIIPTDFKSTIFQRGRSTQPPSSREGFLYQPGFCRNIQRESPLHCTKVPDLERLPLGDCGLKPPAGTVQSSGLQSWPCFLCVYLICIWEMASICRR